MPFKGLGECQIVELNNGSVVRLQSLFCTRIAICYVIRLELRQALISYRDDHMLLLRW